MFIDLLIEDQSGKKAMEILISKLAGNEVAETIRIISYKGLGRLPEGLKPNSNASKRILLDQLPRILKGYGNVPTCKAVVIICDLDDRDKHQFCQSLIVCLILVIRSLMRYFALR
jgi:hypothetical protein